MPQPSRIAGFSPNSQDSPIQDGPRLPNSRPPPMLQLDLESDRSPSTRTAPTEIEGFEGWDRLTPGHARKEVAQVVNEEEADTAGSERTFDGADSLTSASIQLIKATTRSLTNLLEDQLNQVNARFSKSAAIRNNDEVNIILDGQLPRCCFLREGYTRARFVTAVLRWSSLWAVLMAPLACAFALDGERRDLLSPAFRRVDIAITLIYGFGALIVRLRTTVLDDSRESEVASPLRVCRMVLATSTYWLDFVSLATLLPLVVQPIRASNTACRWLPVTALLRSWRLLRSGHDSEIEIQDRWFQYKNVVRLVVWTIIIAHFYACLWFLVLDLSETLRERSWAETDGDNLISLYSHTLVTGAGLLYGLAVPESHSDGERFLLASLFPIAATVMAILFAELVMVATRISIISHRRHEHMAYIQSATTQLGVEPALRRKILKYHSFLQWHHDTEMYRLLFSSISEKLLHELKWQLFRHFIREAPLLHNLGMERILELILAFQEFVFCPGDVVLRHGDQGYEMYFIVKGICDVLDENSRPLAVKHKGDYFGEICLFFPEIRRTATVRARTFCVIALLTRDNFDNIIHEGSEERRRMMKRIAGFHNVKLPPSPPKTHFAMLGRTFSNGSEGRLGKATPEEAMSPDGWTNPSSGVAMSPDTRNKPSSGFKGTGGGSHNGSRAGSHSSNFSNMPRSADNLLTSALPPLDVSSGVPISPKRSPPRMMFNSLDADHSGTPTHSQADSASPFFGGLAQNRERSDWHSTLRLESQVQKLITVVEDLQCSMKLVMSATTGGTSVPSERQAALGPTQCAGYREKQSGPPEVRKNRPSLGYFGSLLLNATGELSESPGSTTSRKQVKMRL